MVTVETASCGLLDQYRFGRLRRDLSVAMPVAQTRSLLDGGEMCPGGTTAASDQDLSNLVETGYATEFSE